MARDKQQEIEDLYRDSPDDYKYDWQYRNNQ